MTIVASPVSAAPCESLYFLHIPKTAGTSVRCWLGDMFSPLDMMPCHTLDEFRQHAEDPNAYRLFSGHFGLELPQHLQRTPTTITWLREPVQRVISNYNYIRSNYDQLKQIAETYNRTKVIEYYDFVCNSTLPQLCKSAYYPGSDNLQVRHLSGAFPNRQRVECDESMLDLAKRNLLGLFHFGICEWMDPSIDLLCYSLGVPWNPLRLSMNHSKLSKKKHELSDDEKSFIRQLNQFDDALYVFAKTEFAQRFQPLWDRLAAARRNHAGWQSGELYLERSVQTAMARLLNDNFQVRRAGTPRASRVSVDFSEPHFVSGWYPRVSQQEGTTIRWAGPDPTSSVFVALQPGAKYQVEFKVLNHVGFEVLQSLALRVGDHVVPLSATRTETENGVHHLMAGTIPESGIPLDKTFTEIEFRVCHTVRCDWGNNWRCSFATDGLQIRAINNTG